MNPFFENRYVGTKSMMMEYIRKIALRRLLHISGAGVLLALSMMIYLIVAGDRPNGIVAGIFMGAFCAVRGLAPLIAMYRLARTSKDMYGDEEFETQVSFSDKIYMTEGKASVSVEYSQIIEVLELDEIYALKTGESSAVLVARGKFTAGDEKNFLSFLRARCFNAEMEE